MALSGRYSESDHVTVVTVTVTPATRRAQRPGVVRVTMMQAAASPSELACAIATARKKRVASNQGRGHMPELWHRRLQAQHTHKKARRLGLGPRRPAAPGLSLSAD